MRGILLTTYEGCQLEILKSPTLTSSDAYAGTHISAVGGLMANGQRPGSLVYEGVHGGKVLPGLQDRGYIRGAPFLLKVSYLTRVSFLGDIFRPIRGTKPHGCSSPFDQPLC